MTNKGKVICIIGVAVLAVCIICILVFSGVGIMISDKLQYDSINKTADSFSANDSAQADFIISSNDFDIAFDDEYNISNESEQVVYYKNANGNNIISFYKEPITVEFDIEGYIASADSDELKQWFELIDVDVPQSYFEYTRLALTITDDDYSVFDKAQSTLCSALVSHKETLYETYKSITVYNGEEFSAIIYSFEDGMQTIEVCYNSNTHEIYNFTTNNQETATALLNGLTFK